MTPTSRLATPRRLAVVVVMGLLLGAVAAFLPQQASQASVRSATSFSATKTVTRVHLTGGVDEPVDSRNVTLNVDQTTNLRERQGIRVTWSGAHPTGGIAPDPNSGGATQEEYPVVLLECRGVDSASASAAARLTPQTCWTQAAEERYQFTNGSNYPAWRLDRNAVAADRTQYVDPPATRPVTCGSLPDAERWLPFVSLNGTSYPGGNTGCAGVPPEAANQSTTDLPSNSTYGVTGLDGTGSAKFNVRTAEDIASLGCSATVPCALVAIPIMGISCDEAVGETPADDATCRATGAFQPGEFSNLLGNEDVAVSGGLWWSASNWANRITVPLQFAPAGNVCQLTSSTSPLDLYGSELMIEATTQWGPAFCLNRSRFTFRHIQTGEPQARNLVNTGSIEAALVTYPPVGGYAKPVVSSPVAVTGFAITFVIDDATRHEYTQLKLTPRLLAKLLTESYPAVPTVQDEYVDLEHNPLNITLDPEFIALNPGIKQGVDATQSAATLFALSSDSDVMRALTSYINADPEARAWLNGHPDPWGMRVNTNYLGIALPVDSWPLLDTYIPPGLITEAANQCLHDAPVPYLPLVAAPTQRLESISLAMQFALANSLTVCSQPFQGTTQGEKLVALGRQVGGFRFMLGVTSLGDAARYELNTASLMTQVSPTADTKFTSPVGRTFVTPSQTAMRAAADLATWDPTAGLWTIPYSTLKTSPKGIGAYPGTMIVYAAVPTQGVPASDAKRYAQLLRFAATSGQVPGTGDGQLPPGFLPMTKGNGLGGLVDYALKAADVVEAQKSTVPVTSGNPTPAGTGSSSPSPSAAAPSASPSSTAKADGQTPLMSLGLTKVSSSTVARLALPSVLGLCLLGVLLAPATAAIGRRGQAKRKPARGRRHSRWRGARS